MKRINTIQELSDLLKDGKLKEQITFNGRLSVYENPQQSILQYTGEMLIKPRFEKSVHIEDSENQYVLEFNTTGAFTFKTRDKMHVVQKNNLDHTLDNYASLWIIPINLNAEAHISIDHLEDIYY